MTVKTMMFTVEPDEELKGVSQYSWEYPRLEIHTFRQDDRKRTRWIRMLRDVEAPEPSHSEFEFPVEELEEIIGYLRRLEQLLARGGRI